MKGSEQKIATRKWSLDWQASGYEGVLRMLFGSFGFVLASASLLFAEPPSASYIFPAGGQRGKEVVVRVGGHYLHDQAEWQVSGPGIAADPMVTRTERIWFEGPLLKLPASQRSEDYPRDYLSKIRIAADAPPGPRFWRAWNAQGATSALRFIVGDLPEIVEAEFEGDAPPQEVSLPATINGRIFPREDVDRWSFELKSGESVRAYVAASEVGAPLEAQLELRDAAGRRLAESSDDNSGNPLLRFTAPQPGRYEIRIADIRASGGPNYVYRLTISSGPWIERVFPLGGKAGQKLALEGVGQALGDGKLEVNLPPGPPGIVRRTFAVGGQSSNEILLDLDDAAEHLEPPSGNRPLLAAPAVGNGRIAVPGERDAWPFEGQKGVGLKLEIRAARLGSPLTGVLAIRDSSGKEVARIDDLADTAPDCELDFTPPADGTYTAEVSERFASRGGPAFAYRLRVAALAPDFRLTLPVDSLAVDVGTAKKLIVNLQRIGGFKEPVKIKLEGLPAGATSDEITVAPNQNKGEFNVQVAATTPVVAARLSVVGRAELAGSQLERRAAIVLPPQPGVFPPGPGMSPGDEVLFVASLPTPFRFRGDYEFRYVPRGGPLKKTYRLERNGFAGPLEVSLADKQGRHLQGVTGPTVVVPAPAEEFTYPVQLAPWMELGRTSRTNLMITGELADAAGKKHKICFVTNEQNEQLIALVSPAPLRITPERATISLPANSTIRLPLRIQRDRSLVGPLQIEVLLPALIRDVTAQAIAVPAEAASAELEIRTGANPGPFHAPLLIRGAGEHQGGPLVAESSIVVLPAP